jgi:chromosome segregation ATPase
MPQVTFPPQDAVWLQLLERCAAEPDCHPSALRSLAQQLAEQWALTVQLQQQVSDQQQQIAVLQASDQQHGVAAVNQENVAQQQQISGLQERVSTQEQLIAAQQQQIAGLQGQLQELRAAVQQLLPSHQP